MLRILLSQAKYWNGLKYHPTSEIYNVEEHRKFRNQGGQILFKSISLIFLIIIYFSVNVFGTVRKISLEEKTKKASLIVIGTVKLTQSQWEELDGGKRIFTYVRIDVEKYIKGSGQR